MLTVTLNPLIPGHRLQFLGAAFSCWDSLHYNDIFSFRLTRLKNNCNLMASLRSLYSNRLMNEYWRHKIFSVIDRAAFSRMEQSVLLPHWYSHLHTVQGLQPLTPMDVTTVIAIVGRMHQPKRYELQYGCMLHGSRPDDYVMITWKVFIDFSV